MNVNTIKTAAFCSATTLVLFGCPDPAKDAPAAKVAPAKSAVSKPAEAAKAAAAPAAAGMAKTLKIDAAASKLEFVGSKVTGKHDGGFKTFSGTIEFDEKNVVASKATIEIDMTSVFSDAEKLTGHLKSPDFFDVEKHPKATFAITSIKAGGEGGASHTMSGKLSIRGQVKDISFPANVAVAADAVSAKAEFSINRQDFGMKYPGKPDDLIRDLVLIKLSVKAPRK